MKSGERAGLQIAFFILSTILFTTESSACTFYGREADYRRYGVKGHFFGELTEVVENRDELGRLINRSAYFLPIKVIWGRWSSAQPINFGPEVSSYRLNEGMIYEFWIDRDGEFRRPCGDLSEPHLYGYDSIEDPLFIQEVSVILWKLSRKENESTVPPEHILYPRQEQ